MKIRRIATRFALILALAAVLPLVGYGAWSLRTLQLGTRDSIVTGNLNVATRAAEEIRRYVFSNAEILKALAADLRTWLGDAQAVFRLFPDEDHASVVLVAAQRSLRLACA